MKSRIFIITVVVLLSVSCLGKQKMDAVLPTKYVEKVDSIPDLTQTDPDLGLLYGGQKSCDSVSVTNSLVWLADHGYENMVLKNEDGSASYAKTAHLLDRILSPASGGTVPPSFIKGLERYFSGQGYSEEDYEIEFQGWYHPDGFEGVLIPNINRIKKGLIGDGAVWLFVGFYQYDRQKDEYQIISHHYVTLVGYGLDEDGKENPNVLIVHDPAPRSGPGTTHNYVHIEEIEGGQITVGSNPLFGFYPQLPIDATGYFRLGNGLAYNDLADIAILDGVIILEMKQTGIPNSGVLTPAQRTLQLHSEPLSSSVRWSNYNLLILYLLHWIDRII